MERAAVEWVAGVLGADHAGLATDFDGTLSPIVPNPADARLPGHVRDALAALSRTLDVVSVVSGRPADALAALIGLPGVKCIGSHGQDCWYRGELTRFSPTAEAVQVLVNAREQMAHRLAGWPGLRVEDKALSVAFHYRLAPDPDAAYRAIVQALEETGFPWAHVVEGRKVVELRLASVPNKGTALMRLAQDHDLSSLVYIGDDMTDLAAFLALKDLRARGARTLGLAVYSDEAPPEVIRAADLTLQGQAEVAEMLALLARALAARPVAPTC